VTSLRFARQVSASHDKLLVRTSSLRLRPRHKPHHVARPRREDTLTMTRGGQFPMACKHANWHPARAAGPDRSLNAALPSCAAVKSPSPPTLQHANSTQGTQAPPTTSSGLRLGLNVTGSSCARTCWITAKLLRESVRRPEVNISARPRGGLYDNVTELLFNASWRTVTRERTSQRPGTVTLILFPFLPLPLRL
jgi:hypothetical protein